MPFATGKSPFGLDAEGTVGYTGALDGTVEMMTPFGSPSPIAFSSEVVIGPPAFETRVTAGPVDGSVTSPVGTPLDAERY